MSNFEQMLIVRRMPIVLYLSLILLAQVNQQRAAASIDTMPTIFLQDRPLSFLNLWLKHTANNNDAINRQQEQQKRRRYELQLWKKYLLIGPSLTRDKRFGNTRYGRNVPND